MTSQVMLPVGAVPESFQGPFSGIVSPSTTDGSITIDARDISVAMNAGFMPAFTRMRNYQTSKAPAAASAATIVADAALVNGTLTIAAQPDQMRPLQFVATPGAAITAGSLTVVYNANDGTVGQTDVFSLVMGSTATTFVTSKGVLHLTSGTVAGLVGGSSPSLECGINASIAVPVNPGAQDPSILKEELDGVDVAVGSRGTLTSKGIYTPNTAPNGTHLYAVDYTMLQW